MAANDEKPVTFGVTIEGPTAPQPAQPALRSAPSNESNMSVTEKETVVDSSNPFSAFYKHPEAKRSMDEDRQLSKTHLDVSICERDLEAGVPLSAATTQQPKLSVDGRLKECTMWPSRQAMMDKKKQTKRARGCNLFRNLNSKQRLWVKILIGLLVLGAAVGLGIGISKAVGGGVWAGDGKSKPINNN
jgi:hypothetical protein